MVRFEQLRKLADWIILYFQPARIILFGSSAYARPGPDSDVDLLVIMPFEGSNLRQSLEILNRVAPTFPVDLLARRPDDSARRYAEGDPLIREAFDRGRVLHERNG